MQVYSFYVSVLLASELYFTKYWYFRNIQATNQEIQQVFAEEDIKCLRGAISFNKQDMKCQTWARSFYNHDEKWQCEQYPYILKMCQMWARSLFIDQMLKLSKTIISINQYVDQMSNVKRIIMKCHMRAEYIYVRIWNVKCDQNSYIQITSKVKHVNFLINRLNAKFEHMIPTSVWRSNVICEHYCYVNRIQNIKCEQYWRIGLSTHEKFI